GTVAPIPNSKNACSTGNSAGRVSAKGKTAVQAIAWVDRLHDFLLSKTRAEHQRPSRMRKEQLAGSTGKCENYSRNQSRFSGHGEKISWPAACKLKWPCSWTRSAPARPERRAGSPWMPEMTPERYHQLCDLFDQAQQRDAGERAQFVQQACANDPALRAELEQLLSQDERASAETLFRQSCPVNAKDLLADREPSTTLADASGDAFLGQCVGPYRIEQRLGKGGMGVVYKAQDIRPGGSVALKFL